MAYAAQGGTPREYGNTFRGGPTKRPSICYNYLYDRCDLGKECKYNHPALKDLKGLVRATKEGEGGSSALVTRNPSPLRITGGKGGLKRPPTPLKQPAAKKAFVSFVQEEEQEGKQEEEHRGEEEEENEEDRYE